MSICIFALGYFIPATSLKPSATGIVFQGMDLLLGSNKLAPHDLPWTRGACTSRPTVVRGLAVPA